LTEEQAKRKLTAILSADVKGYSRLMADDEEATVRTINAYREVMTGLIRDHRGRVVDAKGDNVLAEFSSVVDAVRCAVQVQKDLTDRNFELPEHRRMEFRIGINLGDVIEEQGTIYGDGVNVAARLEGLAEGGGICISGTAFDHVKNRVSVGYEYQGKQSVKNIPDPVRVYKVLLEAEAAGKVIGEEKPRLRKKRWAAMAAVAVLAVLAGGLIWNFYVRPDIEPASVEKMAYPLPDKPSIAVLPFANMIGDSKQDYICDGISEEIITTLSKIPQLFVIDRNSSFSYKGKPVKAKQVAEDLGVRYILEGAVRRSENRLRITAQLIDTIRGNHIWSERYERELKDLFAVQDEITLKIITELGVKLALGEEARLWAKGTEDIEAYLKVLQGRHYINLQSKESNVIARQMAKEAIALDPDFPTAYTLLGSTYLLDVYLGSSKSAKESLEQAEELYRKAIALDDSFAPAHSALCHVYVHRRLYEEAIAEGERAVALNPSAAPAYGWLGTALRFAGREEEAVSTYEKAMRLDPFPSAVLLTGLGNAYHMVGRYEEALTAFKRARSRDPDNMFVHLGLARTYSALNQEKEAQVAAAEVMRIDPKFSLHRFAKTLPYKNQVDKDRIISDLRKAGLPEHPPLPLPDKPSIAVLPFVNMSGDPDQEYFSDGITEEIITALSKIPKLFVIARNSTFTYKGKPVKVQQVGRELGVKYVLEGSVRKAEDQVRITAQLVDATTGHHLWAERYDRELQDIFAIQDEITLEIIKAMQVELTMGETARVTGKGTKNLDAYLSALQAQEEWFRLDKEGSIKARQLATQAIALDPRYGYPYAILAWSHMLDVVRHYSVSPEKSMSLAVEAIQKALALDPSDHRINRVLSNLHVMQGKHDEAIASSKRALELCPGGAGAYENLGIALLFACRPIEAIPMLEKAIQLDPFPPAVCHRNLAMAYCHVGRYEDAIEQGEKAFQINRNDLSTPFVLVFAYAKLGRKEQARAAAAEVLRIDPECTLDSMAETRARMFATKCHSDRVYEDIEFIRKAAVGLK